MKCEAAMRQKASEMHSPRRRRRRRMRRVAFIAGFPAAFHLLCSTIGLLLSSTEITAFLASSSPPLLSLHPHSTWKVPSESTPSSSTTTSLFGIKGFRAWFESQFPTAMSVIDDRGNKNDYSGQTFDHVLVDMNQIIHTVLRKSRNDDHALVLLFKELDAIVALATPTSSFVLAIDGPPAAAKLATQRSRRLNTLVRSEWKIQNIDKFRKRFSKRQLAKKLRSSQGDLSTLRVTPGTEFMKRAEEALLYYAWQRLQYDSKNPLKKCRVYLSPSSVPGEGEVKLLDWIMQKRAKGSVAIVGGDSDLVLESLVIPPQLTHNIFVLLQDGHRRHICVSLWETTRILSSKFLPDASSETILRVRTDLVLLLILNGNDYFPKIRGSSGFNRVFFTYMKLVKNWEASSSEKACLVDPDRLEFNLDFSIAFFRELARMAPDDVPNSSPHPATRNQSPFGQMRNLMASGLLPPQFEFEILEDVEDDDDSDETEEFVDEDDEEGNQYGIEESSPTDVHTGATSTEPRKQVTLRMYLGNPNDPEDFYQYDELVYKSKESIRKGRHKLAKQALYDFLGEEYQEAEDGNGTDGFPGLAAQGYPWELETAAPASVEQYLGGLLWNLQTYQDGVCSDYAYNYGRRQSPTAQDVVDFLERAKAEYSAVGRRELLGTSFSKPVSAGLSCLGALPAMSRDLLPQPYKSLNSTLVDEYFAAAMDPVTNVFDIKKFERLVEADVDKMQMKEFDSFEVGDMFASNESTGRRILMGDHYWTVMGRSRTEVPHPFEPPLPFSDRLYRLKKDSSIRVSRLFATEQPRPRVCWSEENTHIPSGTIKEPQRRHPKQRKEDFSEELLHSDFGSVSDFDSIMDVSFMTAFANAKQRQKKERRVKVNIKSRKTELQPKDKPKNGSAMGKKEKRKSKNVVYVNERRREFGHQLVPTSPLTNSENQNSILVLKQLHDAGLIGEIDWQLTSPSKSNYAVFDPQSHEHVSLTIHPGPTKQESVLDKELFYEQDREIYNESRKNLQQHLASLAICDITGPERRWTDLSFKELRQFLKQRSSKQQQR